VTDAAFVHAKPGGALSGRSGHLTLNSLLQDREPQPPDLFVYLGVGRAADSPVLPPAVACGPPPA